MSDKPETTDDILRGMRDGEVAWALAVIIQVDLMHKILCAIADRIEDAVKRESATAEKSSAVGNAAVLREALVKTLDAFKSGAIRTEWNDPDSWKHDDELWYLKNDIESALSAPARNCDVGTAEEQAERFTKVCVANSKYGARGLCSETCPFNRDYRAECALVWAQMPYKEGGAK